jgi:hypothetical protein
MGWQWALALLSAGGIGGSTILALINKALNRRKDSADSSRAEAEAIQSYYVAAKAAREAAAAADERASRAINDSDDMRQMVQAMRTETDAKIAEVRAESKAELYSLRTRNEQLTTILASMEAQITSNTIDQVEVEWAKKRNVEYEAMKAELTELREKVKEVPHLRAEVARLTELLKDTQREQRLDHEAMRDSLNRGGENISG